MFASGTRRDFLRLAAAGGAAVAIPSLVAGCKLNEGVHSDAATGDVLTFDFIKGDIAFLQFFSAYKQLHADLYTQLAATLSSSDFNTTEQALIPQILSHLIVHRETLKGVLGTANQVTVTPTWGSLNFKKRSEGLNLGVQFSDLAAGMWNGVVQSLNSAATAALVLEMSTVDARHSSAVADASTPKSGGSAGFAPNSQDPAYRLSAVGTAIQQFVIERMQFQNPPAEI